MGFERDYDEAYGGLDDIRATVRGKLWTFPGDPPASTAIEWYRRNSHADPQVNIGDKMVENWRLILGSDQYDKMIDAGCGARALDALYTDLLDAWHIHRKTKAEAQGGLPDDFWLLIPNEIRNAVKSYVLELEDRIEELTEPEPGEPDEPVEAGSGDAGEAQG